MSSTVVFVDFETCICDYDSVIYQRLAERLEGEATIGGGGEFGNRNHVALLDNFDSSKAKSLIKILQEEPQSLLDSPAFPHAIAALHEMKSFGLSVYIVTTAHLIASKISWVAKNANVDWAGRIVVTPDKALLSSSSILIDATPHLQGSWKHIVYARSFNVGFSGGVGRLESWKGWKVLLPFLPASTAALPTATTDSPGNQLPSIGEEQSMAWFLHGSEDSRDVDKVFLFARWPSNAKAITTFASGSGEDRNIFTIGPTGTFHPILRRLESANRRLREGFVRQSLKGPPDEVNNGLWLTYDLHKQEYPLPIKTRAMRSVICRVVIALRAILVKLRRVPPVRVAVVKALESFDFDQRSAAVRAIRFAALADHLSSEDAKYVAFHFGQSLALLEGTEVFTKKSLVRRYPELKGLIYFSADRPSLEDLQVIDRFSAKFHDAISPAQLSKKGDLHFFHAKASAAPPNHFLAQCSGTVIDLKQERVVYWGPNRRAEDSGGLPPADFAANQTLLPSIDGHEYFGVFEYEAKVWFTGMHVISAEEMTKLRALFLAKSARYDVKSLLAKLSPDLKCPILHLNLSASKGEADATPRLVASRALDSMIVAAETLKWP